jgi:hypothetical protein
MMSCSNWATDNAADARFCNQRATPLSRRITTMKLSIATGLGLLLFMATIVGGPLGVSQAQADGLTLASLAGKFASRGSGFETLCFNAGFTALEDCASASQSQRVPFNLTQIAHATRDAAGNGCAVATVTARAVALGPTSATLAPTISPVTTVSTSTSFDPTTGSGTASFSQYRGGSCIGAVFDSTGASLTGTGTVSFMVSDSGNRIEQILMRYSAVTSTVSVAGSVNDPWFTVTSIRQSD